MNREQWYNAIQETWEEIQPHVWRVPGGEPFIDAVTCPSTLENRYRGLLRLGKRKGWIE